VSFSRFEASQKHPKPCSKARQAPSREVRFSIFHLQHSKDLQNALKWQQNHEKQSQQSQQAGQQTGAKQSKPTKQQPTSRPTKQAQSRRPEQQQPTSRPTKQQANKQANKAAANKQANKQAQQSKHAKAAAKSMFDDSVDYFRRHKTFTLLPIGVHSRMNALIVVEQAAGQAGSTQSEHSNSQKALTPFT